MCVVSLASQVPDAAPSHPVEQVSGSGQDGGDVPRRRFVVPFELEVVDLAAEPTVAVAELAVEEVQGGVEHASVVMIRPS